MNPKRRPIPQIRCTSCGSSQLSGPYNGWYARTVQQTVQVSVELDSWSFSDQVEAALLHPEEETEHLDDGEAVPMDACDCECKSCGAPMSISTDQVQTYASHRMEAGSPASTRRKRTIRTLQVELVLPVATPPRPHHPPSWNTCPRCLAACMTLFLSFPRRRDESGKARGTTHVDKFGLCLEIDEANVASIQENLDTESAEFWLQCSNACSDPFLLLESGIHTFAHPGDPFCSFQSSDNSPPASLTELVAASLYSNALLCLASNPHCLGARYRRMILVLIELELPSHGSHRVDHDSLPTSEPSRTIATTRHFERVSTQLKLGVAWNLGRCRTKTRRGKDLLAKALSRTLHGWFYSCDLPDFDESFGAGLEFHGPFQVAWRSGGMDSSMIAPEAALLARDVFRAPHSIDLFDVRSLTPDVAQLLADFQGQCNLYAQDSTGKWQIDSCEHGICFDRLQTLSVTTALSLARGSTPSIHLRGLKDTPSEVLAALRPYRGILYLPDTP